MFSLQCLLQNLLLGKVNIIVVAVVDTSSSVSLSLGFSIR